MTPKRPRDTNQLAKMIVDIATGQRPKDEPPIKPDKTKRSSKKKK